MNIHTNSTAPPADNAPAGCKSSSSCGTSGCNKLNVYNWLADMDALPGQQPFHVIEIRFKGSRKEFFRNKELINLKEGDIVTTESIPGYDIGMVSLTGELVRFQMKKKGITENDSAIRSIYGKATQPDLDKWATQREIEETTMHRARTIAGQLGLVMKISDVEYQGDRKKATFFYTAEDRVDFRELIKKYAEEFKVRVEMRQIGMRQEAGRLGGIGSCGRELCCSTWLTEFKSVSTGAARYQNLSLNPLKLAGQCGKLKCCLNYELDSYMDALKDFPDTNISIETEKGRAFHRKTDIFKRTMWFCYAGDKRGDDSGEGFANNSWVPLSVDRVNEIIALNKKGIKPPDLAEEGHILEVKKEPDYENVVGQDSITRMDRKKSKKKKKKKRETPGNTNTPPPSGRPMRRRPPATPN